MATSQEPRPAFAAPTARTTRAVPPRDGRGLARFGVLAFATFALTNAWAVWASPADRMMGHLQKIMYVHVPTAWAALVAFTIVFVSSIAYLVTRREKWDHLALGAAEAGTLLTAVTLALGSIWGKPTWGIWWTWDPRLTTTAILLMIYAGYLALRAFVDERERAARWCAAVGILGFVNVPIVYMSVRWWRTLHQVQSSPRSMDRTYLLGLLVNSLSVLLVLAWLVAARARAARLEAEVDALHEDRALGAVRPADGRT